MKELLGDSNPMVVANAVAAMTDINEAASADESSNSNFTFANSDSNDEFSFANSESDDNDSEKEL